MCTICNRLRKARNRLLCGEAEALLREALDFLNDAPSFAIRADPRRTSYALAAKIDRHFKGQPVESAPALDPGPLDPGEDEPGPGEVWIGGSHGHFIASRETGEILRRGPACHCEEGCAAADVPAGGAYGSISRVEPETLHPRRAHADVIHVGTFNRAGEYAGPDGECYACGGDLVCGDCPDPHCEANAPRAGRA